MDLEDAAQIGEALGGIAILLTMLFGLRQVFEWNQTRKGEITQRIAEHLSTTLVQRGMGVIANDLKEDFSQEDVLSLSREQKNSINAILVGLNTHCSGFYNSMGLQWVLAKGTHCSYVQAKGALCKYKQKVDN